MRDTAASRAAAAAIADSAFSGPTAGPQRMGAEIELLALNVATRQPASLQRELLPVIESVARDAGWQSVRSPKGAPRFHVPPGGMLTFEPGGQVEYATPPFARPGQLIQHVHHVMTPLTQAACTAGVQLLGAGIDPFNALSASPLQVEADRYLCMDAYFATLGESGARMMRQTASIQLNVDGGEAPLVTWRLLNALVPYLIAIFANSRAYARRDTRHASFRARTWQQLDPSRTGLAWALGDAPRAYAEFALNASAMFMRDESGDYLPLRCWLEKGCATEERIATHVTTLFPEIRPRGRYFEIRSIDALPFANFAAPVLLIAGLLENVRIMNDALELVGDPRPDLLPRAAREGLSDPALATSAAPLVRMALDACEHDNAGCSAQDLDAAHQFFERYTLAGRCPADDPAGGNIASAA